MIEVDENTKGFVYILSVKDIDLPVCKIGMTRRTPYERCDEINNSSTGDFIWEVVYYFVVDNCIKLESLVHLKLAPMRQKGREFFNINADDANNALISIINSQSEISIIHENDILHKNYKKKYRNKIRSYKKLSNKKIDSKYAELLQSFSYLLNVKGRPFGQLNQPSFGMSDGNSGVQWNLSVSTDTGNVCLGVNLEGMKYVNWPISKFILSEMKNPKIEEIATKLDKPENIYIRFSRDAWQVTARPSIVEKHIGGRDFTFEEIDVVQWQALLNEALECLNKDLDYCGRAKQNVTLENQPKNGERVRLMEVSPHLIIWTPLELEGDIQKNIKQKMARLQPIYEWVTSRVS